MFHHCTCAYCQHLLNPAVDTETGVIWNNGWAEVISAAAATSFSLRRSLLLPPADHIPDPAPAIWALYIQMTLLLTLSHPWKANGVLTQDYAAKLRCNSTTLFIGSLCFPWLESLTWIDDIPAEQPRFRSKHSCRMTQLSNTRSHIFTDI